MKNRSKVSKTAVRDRYKLLDLVEEFRNKKAGACPVFNVQLKPKHIARLDREAKEIAKATKLKAWQARAVLFSMAFRMARQAVRAEMGRAAR